MKIDLLVDESKAEEVVDAIVQAARTGHIGDGKIFISPAAEVVRIRTGDAARARSRSTRAVKRACADAVGGSRREPPSEASVVLSSE
jgi:hypothetical protein